MTINRQDIDKICSSNGSKLQLRSVRDYPSSRVNNWHNEMFCLMPSETDTRWWRHRHV